jgi:hypothetical protein
MSLAEVARIAGNFGHSNLTVIPTGSGTWWKCTCSCGYESTRRRTVALAADAAAHHMMISVRAAIASGANLRSLHLVDEEAS